MFFLLKNKIKLFSNYLMSRKLKYLIFNTFSSNTFINVLFYFFPRQTILKAFYLYIKKNFVVRSFLIFNVRFKERKIAWLLNSLNLYFELLMT